ncbi:MAG TPA: M1 family metallopeptidase [Candidatus Baltobacteraceae bacterium]|nr:M1 family metallopeptidase [Candidatus Baltobacteraceae bacterium]
MRSIAAAALASAAIALSAAPAAARVSPAQAPGPLPKTVIPLRYDIHVAPDTTTMKIAGDERITVRVLAPVRRIVLNQLQSTIASATLDGKPVASTAVSEKTQTATFTFAKPVAAGVHTLALRYTATVQSTSQGLFVQKYLDAQGKPARMIGTQMEAVDARRMFPSFDEPVFRSVFHLTADLPAAWTAVSNMPVERTVKLSGVLKRVSFAPTPLMPTYLLVLCAGDFDKLSGSANGTAVHVYGVKGKGPELHYALAALERLIPYFEGYYGIKFPLPKLDLVAIPGFFGGAMENWGGMTFSEDTVVYNPKLQSPLTQREVFDIIAHETSHQWNGDLVTMAWWDGLWLNEGFATWMENKSTATLNPSWNWTYGFDDANDGTMVSDARRTTHPVQMPVHNEIEANEVFDELSYQKAGAFLRMMETYLGPGTFQKGLHRYFVANAYGNTVPSDLWTSLSAVSHTGVASISNSWINKPGFPVVDVRAICSNGKRALHLTQQRYTSDGSPSGSTVWAIPLNVEAAPGHFTPYLFDARSTAIPGGSCSSPLVLNGNDIGYFRVAYDTASQRLQQRFLRTLSVSDRLELLDDAWVFAEDGKAKLGDFLAYMKADSGDTDPHVAGAMIGDLGSMEDYEYGKPGEAAYKRYGIAYLKPVLRALGGWDGPRNDPERNALRGRILSALAEAGDEDAIAQARARFANLSALPPDVKNTVLEIVGRYADEKTYAQLIQAGMASRNPIEMQQYFQAAFTAKDPALAQKSLDMSLQLPPQFQSFGPVIVAIVGQDHPEMAWAFLQKNTGKLFGGMSLFDRLPYVSGIAAAFWRGVPADQIEAYLKANMPASAKLDIDKAMESVRLNQQHRERLIPQIDAYVATQVAGSSGTASK